MNTNPNPKIKPPKGYRLMKRNEKPDRTKEDKFFSLQENRWLDTLMRGDVKQSRYCYAYARKIKP